MSQKLIYVQMPCEKDRHIKKLEEEIKKLEEEVRLWYRRWHYGRGEDNGPNYG